MDAWPGSPGEALHTSTFLGHPVACAASLATLDLLEEGMDREAERIGRGLLEGLRERLGSAAGGSPPVGTGARNRMGTRDASPVPVSRVREIRGVGALIGIELEAAGGAAASEPPGVAAARALLGEGVLVLPAGDGGEVVQLAPPVTLTNEQLAFAIETVAASLTPGTGASTSS